MTPPENPSSHGWNSFHLHRLTPLFQAHAPAEHIDGWTAMRYVFPPEDQGTTLVQMARPHDKWRTQWVEGWEGAKAEWLARQEKGASDGNPA